MLQGIEVIFKDRNKMTKSLKKASYKSYMEGFLREYEYYFSEMKEYVERAEDREAAAKEIGVCIVRAVTQTYANKHGKLDGRTEAELSMFMVYYVFPAILKQGEMGPLIADGVLAAWRVCVNNKDMQYADYDTICQGFREKFLGIF
ncbi:MAG: hypothetical protein Q4C52_03795 [Eubacteriales bacterium]|nr:hypothetical protein [Eubacteriales bacterium]